MGVGEEENAIPPLSYHPCICFLTPPVLQQDKIATLARLHNRKMFVQCIFTYLVV